MKKVSVLGTLVDPVDMQGTLEKVEEYIKEGTPHHIITLNAEIIYRAQHEPALKDIINSAHLVTPDGAGVVWAAGKLGTPVPERVTGIDLVQAILPTAAIKGWRIFLYGAAPGVAEEAARKMVEEYPGIQIAGTSHGYLDAQGQKGLLSSIQKTKPDILLVALGAPKQEYWIREHMDQLKVPVLIGIGGTLDVLAGKAKRAPEAFQRLKLEWLYRLLKEPRRAGRMLALPKFALLVLKESLKK
ncbi:N-acetylmannosaminyltransferase [Clostridiales bacterium PH28_bin88]|nr:N-acetylmannosaminyltransferase [Clostridiales bacterium PH28_bin88]